jgi:hypothetical protein
MIVASMTAAGFLATLTLALLYPMEESALIAPSG